MKDAEIPQDEANATEFDSVLTGQKKLFVKTYGCQMNVYDSERMSDVLAPHGFVATGSPEDADLIVLNTCHIREKAAEKVYSELGRLRALSEKRTGRGRETLIAVAGCVAQAEGEEIIRRAPAVDFVFGPQVLHRLGDLVARARAGERVVETDFPVEDKFALMPAPDRRAIAARGRSAFLTVQEGCDKFCTFCVVPYTRGAEVSRPVAAIVAEAERLADAGVVEITLIGQNVNAYHGRSEDGAPSTLARLIRRLADIEGIKRLRYTTSHPRDMDDALIAVHGEEDKLMPYLHLPIQSGSDRVLKLMNRRHTVAAYRDIVARLRAARPDIALSSDFIVGFPGETEADFAATLEEIKAAVHRRQTRGQDTAWQLTLLHCVSQYPTRPEYCHLAQISRLRSALNGIAGVGWSDHSVNEGVIFRAAYRYNAEMIEFHLDLDDYKGAEYNQGHCWGIWAIRDVIRQIKAGLRADGDLDYSPDYLERDFRADPEDGLRPPKDMRARL